MKKNTKRTVLKITGMALGLAMLAILSLGALGTGAWFNDQETTTGNSISAGTLDLTIDGGNTNVVKFNVTNAKPGNQPVGYWLLKNVGTVAGKLSIESTNVVEAGGVVTEPEISAGDTGNAGNLGELLNIRLYVDNAPITGYRGYEDPIFYDGLLKNLDKTAFNALNLNLAAGQEIRINAVIDWQSHAGTQDNLGQGDTLSFDLNFFGLMVLFGCFSQQNLIN